MSSSRAAFWNETGVLIRRCHQINQALFAEEVTSLTPVQSAALRIVCERPGIDQRRLSEIAGLDEATMGGVIRRLVDRSYLRRVSDPADKRVKQLIATPAGVEAWNQTVPGLQRLQDRLLAPLTESEREALKLLLRRLVDAHENVFHAKSSARGKGAAASTSKAEPGC
jgi:DNA-binding MarR family transcriptional regulator